MKDKGKKGESARANLTDDPAEAWFKGENLAPPARIRRLKTGQSGEEGRGVMKEERRNAGWDGQELESGTKAEISRKPVKPDGPGRPLPVSFSLKKKKKKKKNPGGYELSDDKLHFSAVSLSR
ncbi:hypothetical protein D4764_09G0004300 [Takifugu flavidus]|uniref:Uncharacterized protein n=1 Tax=Takifugu flavidus TaxID=433684 RepID=A0A5C6MMI8_9TELE|nr:hypothetical protein D4764_09G0004300 [Takifugu flavidus]